MGTGIQIIVIKRKGGHGGHHGGAWKVAYADFVTAMMALFIVLWLMNSNKKVQEAVGGYFKDPTHKAQPAPPPTPQPPKLEAKTQDMTKLKQELQAAIQQMPDFQKLKSHIEITITSEGLRIELMESAKGTFFESGSSQPTATGRELMVTLAREIGKLPNKVSIEGHTDAKPYSGIAEYSNWELSTDRANTSRRLMAQSGLREDQVVEVRGFADQRLRNEKNPLDPSNRRISLIVRYLEQKAPELPRSVAPGSKEPVAAS